jgi:hypothetical protein
VRKTPAIFLLVISLLWQAFAMASVGFAQDHGDSIEHVVLHLDKEPHHHHDDGTFHEDGTDESVKHVYADSCANTAGVVPTHAAAARVEIIRRAQPSFSAADPDSAILEGPRRPPRLTA